MSVREEENNWPRYCHHSLENIKQYTEQFAIACKTPCTVGRAHTHLVINPDCVLQMPLLFILLPVCLKLFLADLTFLEWTETQGET